MSPPVPDAAPSAVPAPRWWSFPRPVWLLGVVSLLTDTATEAAYPLLPAFLLSLGATPVMLGGIEGTAEAIASLCKIWAGRWSDRAKRRQPIVMLGYGISSLVRPLLAVAGAPWHVAAVRFTDRVGKGIRGAPRDALLAHYAGAEQRGRVFGFHRAMDHMGAVLGPLLAAAYLWFRPGEFREVFLLTLMPGLAVLAVLWRVRDPERPVRPVAAPASPGDPAARLPGSFWRLMAILGLFTLGNSSDAFLLLALAQAGFSPTGLALLWAAQHVVKSASSLVGGAASDRLGRTRTIGAGWLVYAAIYAGFAALTSPSALVALFLAYGLYHGLTEGAEKALIADVVPAAGRGLAFGVYGATLGIGALVASVLFGAIWTWVSAPAAFLTGAALALAATAALSLVPSPSGPSAPRA
jgi:MFS family permease